MAQRPDRLAGAGWALLGLLLSALLVAAATFDRAAWPSLVGDEATYLMAAQSLAFDFDLAFERGDYDRFVGSWGTAPEGLILQSGDGGEHIAFGKPFFYPLYLAPFVRLAPVRGVFVANALLLALAALATARALRPRVGAAAPWLVVALVFASVTFAYAFWAHADLFLACLTALALALLLAPAIAAGAAVPIPAARATVAGTLLAAVAFSRPLYAGLLLVPLLAAFDAARASGRRAWRGAAWALLGIVALGTAAAAVHLASGGSWSGYGGERRGFYERTGFPAVDFPASEWSQRLSELGNTAWVDDAATRLLPAYPQHPRLWGWNACYFLAGRHVGLLPYYLPALLGLLGRPRGAVSWGLALAVALAAAGFFFLRPFNFYGGGGALANRYFLPVYPALWFLCRKRLHPAWPVLVAVAAAPFLAPLWASPRSFPFRDDLTYRYVSPTAQRLLPYETTQSHLKPAGREDVIHHGLWVKFLDAGALPVADGQRLRLRSGVPATLLVGHATPLERLRLEVAGQAPSSLAVEGAEVEPLAPRQWGLRLDGPRAVHPMWWTWEPFYLYRLELRVKAPWESIEVALRATEGE